MELKFVKDLIVFCASSIIVFFLAFLIFIGGGFIGLWWYPYQIQQQTAIVRQSNAYVTSQQDGIAEMISGYYKTTDPNQKKADLNQICQMNSELNNENYLTPMEQSFVSSNCQD